MADILIYTKLGCPYCTRAKALLSDKGAEFTEIDLLEHSEKRDEMLEKSGGRTSVPQIFINDKHIGGCDDLIATDEAGELDPLLG
tara:strand:+ start:157778 stop:158032 length:255 start_codon:yes stop_codon:yes gene_type:complete